MKRVALLLLALMLAASVALAESEMVTEEKVTIKVVASQAIHSSDFNTMRFWQDMEEKTNVHVEFTMWDQTAVSEKLATMLASQEYPDVSFVSLGDSDTYLYGQFGELLALNDLIDQYAPNWKKAFEQYPVIKDAITMPDGNIYALPFVRYDPTNYGIRDAMLINKTWLDKLELDVPTTPDELITVLKAFKERDPNGNGEADEIPFLARLWAYSNGICDVFGWYGNAFGSNTANFCIAVRDGQVYLPVTEPSYKDAVLFLRELYKEGLLDQNLVTQNVAEFQSKIKYDPLIVGMVPVYHGATEFGFNIVNENYVALLPLDTGYTPLVRQQQNQIERNRAVIFKSNPYPEITMRWLDALASEENSFTAFYGYPGTHLIAEADGTFTPDAVPYAERTLEIPANLGGSFFLSEQVVKKCNKTAGGDLLRLKFVEAYEPYRMEKDDMYPLLFMTSEQSDALSASGLSDWKDYCKTTLAKWITEGGIEEQWDEYVTKIQALAAPSLVVYQDALDIYNGK